MKRRDFVHPFVTIAATFGWAFSVGFTLATLTYERLTGRKP